MKQQRATERTGHWLGILLVGWFLLSHFSAHAQVGGYVFRDFNADGIRTDRNPIEPGVSGATVRVFVDIDPTPRTMLTRADGTFSFDATAVPPGKPLRVEFTGFETGYYTGPFGAGSGTTVQFVTSGASATAVYAGINYPADYCQAAPPVVTPCYVNGDPLNLNDENGNPITDNTKKAALADVLVSIPFGATGIAGSDGPANTPGHLAVGREVGSIWGVAFQRRTGILFAGATIKRHAGLGPLGTGGIYTTNMNLATPISTSFVNVRDLGIDTGDNPHGLITGSKQEASRDVGAVDAVGKRAIGGVDMSEDDKSLYFVNLNDRKVYNVLIDIPGAPGALPDASHVTSWTIADPGCVNGVFRPWALKNYRGKVYIAGVCTGELLSGTATGGTNNATTDFDNAFAHRNDLVGYIYRFDPTLGSSAPFEKVLTIPLSFTRGAADLTEDCINYKYWFPWTNKFAPACNTKTGTYLSVMWPQPIISDISFDDDGSIFIGMMDRFGFIAGNRNLSPDLTDNKLYDGFTGGDLLRAQRNADGTYTLESNGTTGTRTNPAGVGNNQGPGGGEFFTDDYFTFYGKIVHDENLNGALTYVPGSGEVFSSAFDPYSAPDNSVFRAGGFKMLDPRTGLSTRSFVLYQNKPGEDPVLNGTFGKAAGLGDAQALCEAAPIEIGNRVWYDDNRNGIQEAYETGIDGLTLTLHDMQDGGRLIATQVTRNGGQFYFNNTTVSPAKLLPKHRYQVRLSADQLPRITLTPALRGARRGSRAAAVGDRSFSISPFGQGNDLTNSKGVMDGDFIKIDALTGDYGQNAHIYDLSVYSCPVLTVTRKTVQVCEGQRAPDVTMNGSYFARFDKIQFVEFDTPKSGTAMYGPGGRVLGEFTPASYTSTDPESFTLSGSTISTARANKYIYALVSPAPNDPACRPFDETIIEITPTPVVSATGATITCSATAVTLTSLATDSKGNSLTGVSYRWAGPGSYTANTQNAVVTQTGSYTVSATTTQCPASPGTAVVSVTADTAVPSLTLTATPSGTVLVGTSLTLTTQGCTAGTLVLSSPRIVTAVEGTNLYSATCTNGSGCRATVTVSVTGVLERSIVVKAQSACIKNTPYVSYTVTAVNFTPQNDVTITIRKFADNSLVETKTNQPFTGSFLYSGAKVDGQGNPTDWPGWDFINGEWIMVDDGLKPMLKLSFSVNPTAETTVGYPAPSPDCLSGPLHGLGDRVWKDNNNNGIQDSGEPGIAGFRVELYTVINNVRSTSAVSTTTTDGQGYYLFPDLPFGSYQVRFVPGSIPANCQPSPAFVGTDRAADSNASPTTGFSDVIVLSDTDTTRPNRTVDAGFAPCVPVCVPISSRRLK